MPPFTPLMDYYYGFPQRFIAGIPTEETPLTYGKYTSPFGAGLSIMTTNGRPRLDIDGAKFTIKREDTASVALNILESDTYVARARKGLENSKQSLVAGYGTTEGRVYAPESDDQALRNLNFAIANLAAYREWHDTIKPAKVKAEAEAKLKAERESTEARVREARRKKGLDLYNKVNGTRHSTWAYTSVSPLKQEAWAKQAEEVATLQRISNPYSSSIFAGDIAAGSITASLYPTSFRL